MSRTHREFIPEDGAQPWDRITRKRCDYEIAETSKTYNMFLTFRDMGPDRSIPAFVRLTGESRSYSERLAKYNCWHSRARAWDEHLEKVRQKAKEREIEDMTKRHTNAAFASAEALLIPVKTLLRKAKSNEKLFEEMTLKDLFEMVATAAEKLPKVTDMERKARGVPNNIEKTDVNFTSDGKAITPILSIQVNGSQSPLLQSLLDEAKVLEDNGRIKLNGKSALPENVDADQSGEE